MIDAFGKSHFLWQKAIVTHLNLMTCPTSGIPPLATFVCAPMGRGKLIAHVFFAAGQGNVSWCISPSVGEPLPVGEASPGLLQLVRSSPCKKKK
jgi:hypothetical protein